MKLSLLIYLLVCSIISFGQDVHFSQFSETPLQSNPALAGLFSGDMRIQGVTRSQWQSITVPFETSSLNCEFKLPVGRGNDFLTLGGSVLYDKAGTAALTSTNIMPAINFHKSLSDDKNLYLSAGFMGGFVQRRIDRSKITTNSQYDGSQYVPGSLDGESSLVPSYSYMDGAAGMSLNGQLTQDENDNFFIGIAYHHFANPSKAGFYENNKISLTPKWVFTGGTRTSIDEVSFLTFYGEFTKQGPSQEIIGGLLYSYKLQDNVNSKYVLHGGGFIRWNDAIIPVVKLEYKPFTIGVSYDANISQLKTFSQGRGGFELSVTYQRFFNNESSSVTTTRCPKF